MGLHRYCAQLVRDGVVTSISAETIRQILIHHRLKPWRQKMWLSPKVPRDAAFAAQVQSICEPYTRPLRVDEVVLCIDEMTSLQPRPRGSKTLPTKKDLPTRVEHEYGRCGALNLFAAFDTRTGKVCGFTASRKRETNQTLTLCREARFAINKSLEPPWPASSHQSHNPASDATAGIRGVNLFNSFNERVRSRRTA